MKGMSCRRTVLLVLTLCLLLPAFGGNRSGQLATDIKLEPVAGGKAVSLSQFRGQPVLLIFWATWCGPCRREIPAIKSLHDKYSPGGLKIVSVGIASRQTRESVAAFKLKNDLPYEVLWDAYGDVSDLYQIEAVPTNLLIDPEGVIRHRSSDIGPSLVALIETYAKPKAAK